MMGGQFEGKAIPRTHLIIELSKRLLMRLGG